MLPIDMEMPEPGLTPIIPRGIDAAIELVKIEQTPQPVRSAK
jgi:hypothetical protein